MSCCIDRVAAQCTVAAPTDGALLDASIAGACTSTPLLAGETCLVACNDGYECSGDPCQFECSAGSVLTSPTCSPRGCTMERPTFGDWGTCDDASASTSPSIVRDHGVDCFIQCAAGYIGRPRQAAIPAGQQGPASRWALQTCTLGVLGGPGPGAICVEPEPCELLVSRDLPANATWGTCTTEHPTNSSIRLLDHGQTCQIACNRNFNVSTAPGESEISCDDGSVTNNMHCEYTAPPEPEPEPSEWEGEGYWVVYDTEGTLVKECTSAEDETYRFVVPATGEGCPDSDDVTNELAQIYDNQYEGERSGKPCVWDPVFYKEYPSAAGINLTLAWAYEAMEAEYPTRGDFQAAFELEMVRGCAPAPSLTRANPAPHR